MNNHQQSRTAIRHNDGKPPFTLTDVKFSVQLKVGRSKRLALKQDKELWKEPGFLLQVSGLWMNSLALLEKGSKRKHMLLHPSKKISVRKKSNYLVNQTRTTQSINFLHFFWNRANKSFSKVSLDLCPSWKESRGVRARGCIPTDEQPEQDKGRPLSVFFSGTYFVLVECYWFLEHHSHKWDESCSMSFVTQNPLSTIWLSILLWATSISWRKLPKKMEDVIWVAPGRRYWLEKGQCRKRGSVLDTESNWFPQSHRLKPRQWDFAWWFPCEFSSFCLALWIWDTKLGISLEFLKFFFVFVLVLNFW